MNRFWRRGAMETAPMTRILLRFVALMTALAVTSPAWAGWDDILAWLPRSTPQLEAPAMLGIAIVGIFVGLLASRKRRQP